MEYKISWIDATIFDDRESDDVELIEKEIYSRIMQVVPCGLVVYIDSIGGDWIDYSVSMTFICSLEKLKDTVSKIINGQGRDIDVFSVFDFYGNRILTEEDF